MSHKFDQKKENINKIKKDIENTRENVELADDMINSVTDAVDINELREKNERRKEAINSMVEDVQKKITD